MTDPKQPIIPPYEPEPPELREVEGGYVLAESYPDDGNPVWQAERLRLREEVAQLRKRLDSSPISEAVEVADRGPKVEPVYCRHGFESQTGKCVPMESGSYGPYCPLAWEREDDEDDDA